jgi:polyferredoxin
LVLVGGLILFNLMTRHLIELHVVHDRNPLYVALSDGTVRNGYELNIVNKDLQPRRYRVELEGLPSAVLTIRGVAEHEISEVVAKANDSIKLRAFIVARVPVAMQTPIRLRLVPLDGGQAAAHESMFMSHGAQ